MPSDSRRHRPVLRHNRPRRPRRRRPRRCQPGHRKIAHPSPLHQPLLTVSEVFFSLTRRSNASSPPPCDISDDPLFPTPTHHPLSVTSSLLDLCRTAYTAVSVEPFCFHYCSRQKPIQTERPANLPFRTLGPLAWQPQLRLKTFYPLTVRSSSVPWQRTSAHQQILAFHSSSPLLFLPDAVGCNRCASSRRFHRTLTPHSHRRRRKLVPCHRYCFNFVAEPLSPERPVTRVQLLCQWAIDPPWTHWRPRAKTGTVSTRISARLEDAACSTTETMSRFLALLFRPGLYYQCPTPHFDPPRTERFP